MSALWPINVSCEVLEVSASGYFEHMRGKASAKPSKAGSGRRLSDEAVLAHNAPTESLWGRLKVGRLHGRKFATRRQAMDEVIAWLTFYNHRRLHSSLGYMSPMQFEQRWHEAQRKKAA